MTKRAIIYFLRVPRLGVGKTRLKNFLSPEARLQVSRYLVKKNYQVVTSLDSVDVFLTIPQEDNPENLHALLEDLNNPIFRQADAELGERMHQALVKVFQKGYDQVALVGSDLYDLETGDLSQAFCQLDASDVVLAPSQDGGYGLIAMKKPLQEAFSIAEYSHDQVFDQTVAAIEEAGYSWSGLGLLLDIDDRDDIAKALSGDMKAHFHSQGEYNANFIFDQDRKLLRIAMGSQMHLDQQIAYEYYAIKGLQPSGSVVEVFDLVDHHPLLGEGFLTEAFVEGRSLNYHTDLDIAARLLAGVHQVDEKTIPHLIRADQPFQVMMDEFQSMFQHYRDWERKDPVVLAKVEAMLQSLKKYDLNQAIQDPCVINTELNSGNFIVNPEGDSYIIDWEKPLVGDREQDLGHFLAPTTTLWKTDVLLGFDEVMAFVDQYDSYADQQVDRKKLVQYLQFTCLRGITWCAMAYTQYVDEVKEGRDDQTFQVIQRFINLDFLEAIENYIKKGDDFIDA